MITEPTKTTHTYYIGDATINLVGENWGKGPQDTRVTIGDSYLCWISWDTKEEFIKELQEIVEKHRI